MSEVLSVKEDKGSCILQGATRMCLYRAPSSIAEGVTAQYAACWGLFPSPLHSQCGLLGEVDSKKALDLVHYGR